MRASLSLYRKEEKLEEGSEDRIVEVEGDGVTALSIDESGVESSTRGTGAIGLGAAFRGGIPAGLCRDERTVSARNRLSLARKRDSFRRESAHSGKIYPLLPSSVSLGVMGPKVARYSPNQKLGSIFEKNLLRPG